MKEPKNLEYFKKLPFKAIVEKRGDVFIVYVPELDLLEEDSDLGKAHQKLEIEKEHYFQKMIENGYEDYIREPEKTTMKSGLLHDLMPFFIKLGVVVVVFGVLGLVGVKKFATADYLARKLLYIGYNLEENYKRMPQEKRQVLDRAGSKLLTIIPSRDVLQGRKRPIDLGDRYEIE